MARLEDNLTRSLIPNLIRNLTNYPRLRAVTLGVAIPALIIAMTKVGALMWIDTHARTA